MPIGLLIPGARTNILARLFGQQRRGDRGDGVANIPHSFVGQHIHVFDRVAKAPVVDKIRAGNGRQHAGDLERWRNIHGHNPGVGQGAAQGARSQHAGAHRQIGPGERLHGGEDLGEVDQVFLLDLDDAQPLGGELVEQGLDQGRLARAAGAPEQGVVGRQTGEKLACIVNHDLLLLLDAEQFVEGVIEAIRSVPLADLAAEVNGRRGSRTGRNGVAASKRARATETDAASLLLEPRRSLNRSTAPPT